MNKTIHISRIPFHTDKSKLFYLFQYYNIKVSEIKIKTNNNNKPLYAFALFDNIEDYIKSLSLDGLIFYGKSIIIRPAINNFKENIFSMMNVNMTIICDNLYINEIHLRDILNNMGIYNIEDIDIARIIKEGKIMKCNFFLNLENGYSFDWILNKYKYYNYKNKIFAQFNISNNYAKLMNINEYTKSIEEELKSFIEEENRIKDLKEIWRLSKELSIGK